MNTAKDDKNDDRCRALIGGRWYRCSRRATTVIRGMALCTQHANVERRAG